MKIETAFSDQAILQELGARIANTRLERNLTQADLAKEAGVSKRTVERLESGEVATHEEINAPKIVIAIAGQGTDTWHVCKLASPFQDMVNPQVNLFQ